MEAEEASSPDLDHEHNLQSCESHPLLQSHPRTSQPTTLLLCWFTRRVQHVAQMIAIWSKGPTPPQIYKIEPYYETIQELPVRLLDQHFPFRSSRALLLTIWCSCWLLTFGLILNHSEKAGYIRGYGKPEPISCRTTFWGRNNECGLAGNLCRPFDNATLSFRCPGNCRATQVFNPRAIGDQEVNYSPFVIGGPSSGSSGTDHAVYRGDSFICQAAIHSGILSNEQGGCGVAALRGQQLGFAGTKRYGIQSYSFDSCFPKSFTFVARLSADCFKDMKWPLLIVTCGFAVVLSIFTTSTSVFFFLVFTIIFFHVGLVSDPPHHSDFATLFSIIVGRFLPAAFCSVVFYLYAVEPQQKEMKARFERTVLWLGGVWIGALNNYTFSFIPIQRLTPHDIEAQDGAVAALIIVVTILFVIALQQACYLRQEGRFRKYLAIYLTMGGILLIGVAIPQLHLRLHHYFLALILLPGTRTQTRPSLLYQGILVGLFINGTARWGFDPILQTSNELRGDDGQVGSVLPTVVNLTSSISNITFGWAPHLPQSFDGISVLRNDVEVYRWYSDESGAGATFYRSIYSMKDSENERILSEYFRFAYMKGSETGDYTRAGIWEIDGQWTPMIPGPSKS